MPLAERLKKLRADEGQSLQQVADAVGVSKAHVSDLERGTTANPSLDLLKKLAAHFSVSVGFLIDDEPTSAPIVVNSSQVELWIKQVRRAQAAGLDLENAAQEAKEIFEQQMGRSLDETQTATWRAAKEEIKKALSQEIEFLGTNSLRKPRRPIWYPGPKPNDQNWPKLQAYMHETLRWDSDTILSIDNTSTEVVGLMDNPVQSVFRGRGLVVGYVQSGKTANMTAVIAKAVDAGYRFVIVLTGMTNSLRRQTQRRLVRDLCERNKYGWYQHTNNDADFRSPANLWFQVTNDVQLAVIKKNVSPLTELLNTIRQTPEILRDRMPVLLIDDECDQAGVNATGSQYNMTAINRLIREIITALPRVQYVGYTATPFANILINPRTPEGVMDDLYPEDFITALPLPQGYFGAESLFGREPINADEETPAESGLNMIRPVPQKDADAVRPPSRKAGGSFAPGIPPSLEEALTYFILASACRRARGQAKSHSSMLIHTTVYKRPHERHREAVAEWIEEFRAGLRTGTRQEDLRNLWDEERSKVNASRFGRVSETFEVIEPHIDAVLEALELVVENSESETRLDFESGPKTYIVIGGSVLARGLTIEGLVVSYFVRSTGQYDTLLQMGRWFGYRNGFEDLPRIWMTGELSSAFRDLATVEAEIRTDIATYRERDVTPADFAVRIRQIPGMTITAAKKMVAAEDCDISYSGEHLQTIRFHHENADELKHNWKAGADLITAAARESTVEVGKGGRLYRGVPLDDVVHFLKAYRGSQRDLFSESLVRYVTEEAARSDQPFAKWNVGIVEPAKQVASQKELGPLGKVSLVNRARLVDLSGGMADIKALMSRRDVLLDAPGADKVADNWQALKDERQRLVGDKIPLLLLYAINANSVAAEGSQSRVDLNAATDILGVGIVFPDRGERKSYVRVALIPDDAEGDDDLAAALEDNEASQ